MVFKPAVQYFYFPPLAVTVITKTPLMCFWHRRVSNVTVASIVQTSACLLPCDILENQFSTKAGSKTSVSCKNAEIYLLDIDLIIV